jgi:hypothetical protein
LYGWRLRTSEKLDLGGRKRKLQTASAVLCYSRMLFFQCYPNFRRFDCKVFLTEALRFMGGATTRVMIDNTRVVVLRGSGRDMVPAPEMAPASDAGRASSPARPERRAARSTSGREAIVTAAPELAGYVAG